MMRLADIPFLERVAANPSRKGTPVAGHKLRMLQVVLRGRKDLLDQLKSMQGSNS
jgi:hypothetical protein